MERFRNPTADITLARLSMQTRERIRDERRSAKDKRESKTPDMSQPLQSPLETLVLSPREILLEQLEAKVQWLREMRDQGNISPRKFQAVMSRTMVEINRMKGGK